MKTFVHALSNMFAVGNRQDDSAFLFYNATLAGSFLLIVLITGDMKTLLIAVGMIMTFLGLVIVWALVFYKEG